MLLMRELVRLATNVVRSGIATGRLWLVLVIVIAAVVVAITTTVTVVGPVVLYPFL